MTDLSETAGVPFHFRSTWDAPPLELPDQAQLMIYVVVNVESFDVGSGGPTISGLTKGSTPDPLNYGWREYGARVGVWRMMRLFDELDIPVTAAINSDVCWKYPAIVEAGIQRNWAWLGHGKRNSSFHIGLSLDEEREMLEEVVEVLGRSLPAMPKGWLSPALSETVNTLPLLRDLGFEYVLNWCCDDDPFEFVPTGLMSVPYQNELNDMGIFPRRGVPGEIYVQLVRDHIDVLLEEGNKVLALPLHTFVMGQPSRFKYLRELLQGLVADPRIRFGTVEDVADVCRVALGR